MLEHNHEDMLSDTVEPTDKELNRGMVMPADYSPHQKHKLEDYEIKTTTKNMVEGIV